MTEVNITDADIGKHRSEAKGVSLAPEGTKANEENGQVISFKGSLL